MMPVDEKVKESPGLRVENSPPVEFTVLMPCLNEAQTIAACVGKAKRFIESSGLRAEILIADNGSDDGSPEIARALGARVIVVGEKGYGAALSGGIEAARGTYIIMGDADDSYDFSALGKFLDALRAGADLVMGNRFKGGIKKGAMPFLHRRIGNPVLSFLGRLFYGVPIGDFHCGLRGFRADAIRGLNLRATGMEFASEMVVKASLMRLRIAEVPTTLSPDGRLRPPHLKTWRDGWRHLKFLLLHSPRWLFLYPALAMIFTGLTLITLTGAIDFRVTNSVSIGVHSLLVGCFLVLIGTQLISFAVLSRRHAMQEGFLPGDTLKPLLGRFTLERMLQFAGVLLLLGVIGFAWSIAIWARQDFGPLEEGPVLRLLSISLTVVATAIQLASTAFLGSVFQIRRR